MYITTRLKSILKLAFVALVLASCASPSIYRAQGSAGVFGVKGGYQETRLGADKWRVSFSGNPDTTQLRVFDLALLRAADLTLKNGFSYFILQNTNTKINTGQYREPKSTNIVVSTDKNSKFTSVKENTVGGGVTVFTSYRVTHQIMMLKVKPSNANNSVYDAALVCNKVATKYQASCENTASKSTTD